MKGMQFQASRGYKNNPEVVGKRCWFKPGQPWFPVIRRLLVVLSISFLGSLFAPYQVQAAGVLDPTFGTDGRVITDIDVHDVVNGVITQSDGKIIIGGHTGNGYAGSNCFISRYIVDGSLDASFGVGGNVITNIQEPCSITRLALQSDGKIVATGIGSGTYGKFFVVFRYNPDGMLDPSFGERGIVATYFSSLSVPVAVAVQPDNKILVVGYTWGTLDFSDSDIVLARYTSSGALDQGFGRGGKVTTNFDARDQTRAAVLQPDGKILVSLTANLNTNPVEMLVRYRSDGTLDSSFGTDGKVVMEFAAQGLEIQADGKLVVAGGKLSGGYGGTAVARYLPNGGPDLLFGSNGTVVTSFAPYHGGATNVLLQADGKILAAGSGVTRYLSNGAIDLGFGDNGTTSGRRGAVGAALQPDGKIVTARYFYTNAPEIDIELSRYHGADNTLTGNNITVPVGSGVTVNFLSVYTSGDTTVSTAVVGPTPPSGF